MQLCLEVRHVLCRDDLRVDVVLDGEVFGGQAEGIPAHGVQDVIALHPALSCYDIQSGIGTGVPHVQPLPGGIGELHQRIVFGLGVVIFGVERTGLLPFFLPFRFDFLKFVFQRSSSQPHSAPRRLLCFCKNQFSPVKSSGRRGASAHTRSML